MSKLNIELLKKVRNRIATVPESYSQRHFVKRSSKAPCGTVCCLAGETIICAAPTISEGVEELKAIEFASAPNDGSPWSSLIPHRAQELLGLNDSDAWDLFEYAENNWPEPFRSQYAAAQSNTERANVAVLLLDQIITTGKVPQ